MLLWTITFLTWTGPTIRPKLNIEVNAMKMSMIQEAQRPNDELEGCSATAHQLTAPR